jgi:hypothetical protein
MGEKAVGCVLDHDGATNPQEGLLPRSAKMVVQKRNQHVMLLNRPVVGIRIAFRPDGKLRPPLGTT